MFIFGPLDHGPFEPPPFLVTGAVQGLLAEGTSSSSLLIIAILRFPSLPVTEAGSGIESSQSGLGLLPSSPCMICDIELKVE